MNVQKLKAQKFCKCRNCDKKYNSFTARGNYRGYCSAKCEHEMAKSLGYKKKGGTTSEYQTLNGAGETRITKAMVKAEMDTLRCRIATVIRMTDEQLSAEYAVCFPNFVNNSPARPSRTDMMGSILSAATFHMTNVLGIE